MRAMALPWALFDRSAYWVCLAACSSFAPFLSGGGPLHLPDHEVVPVGLHGDGVPHQKSDTIECISWNFPGLPHTDRILCSVLEKTYLCDCGCSGRHTTNKMIEVLCWSFRHLAAGKFPTSRHDGEPWKAEDMGRSQQAGRPLGARGLLCQVRVDWAWYKQIFDFPSWGASEICWRCKANTTTIPWTDASASAKWRTSRLTDAQFWARQRADGKTHCPLFDLPGFRLGMVTVDILHALDLGIAQDLTGILIWEYIHKIAPGKTIADRVKSTWAKLHKF